MASFGENLQREREMRGVSLEEIAAATKISGRILKAIEVGDISKLPSGVYARNFIRQYARYLGLDEERVLAEYLLVAPSRSDLDLSRMASPKPEELAGNSRASLLALLIAAVLLGVGYLIYTQTRRAPESPAPSAQNAAREATPSATPVKTAAAPRESAASLGAATAPPTPQAPSPLASSTQGGSRGAGPAEAGAQPGESADSPRASLGEGELTLQVTATEKSWVAVEADGKPSFQRTLMPTEVETVKAKESFTVLTGNAAGIVLTLNSQTLSPLGGRGVTKRVHLTRDDLKNPAP